MQSIISQQLSAKVADTIYGRFRALAGDDISPENVATIPDEWMRTVDLGGRRGWAKIFGLDEPVDVKALLEAG